MKILILILLCFNCYSQEYTEIIKNINPRGKNLIHELNKTTDTLLLSGININLVKIKKQFVTNDITFTIESNFDKIPLTNLTPGRYVVLVYTGLDVIVFNLQRILKFKTEEPEITVKSKKRPYNLSTTDRRYRQTRAEYRKENLRPNGKKYN